MPTNHYFQNFSPATTNEQKLLQDLIDENIQIMGHDVYYIVRGDYNGTDEIMGEATHPVYTNAYKLDMYLNDVERFMGQGEFFSKFGVEIRDNTSFMVSKRTFDRFVPSNIAIRPRAGDLIYVPVMHKFFEIKFVEDEDNFFALGKRYAYYYLLKTEAFRYNQGDFSTGISEIDNIERKISYTQEIVFNTGSGNYHRGEVVYQGANLQSATATAEVSNWHPTNTTLHIINISGVMYTNNTTIGVDSNAQYTFATDIDIRADHVFYDRYQNSDIQSEANTFIVTDETNAFGMP